MERSVKVLLSCAVAMALSTQISGCNRDRDQGDKAATAPGAERPAPAASPEPAPAPAGSEAPAAGTDALAQVGAVDKHEIAAAEQARDKKVTGAVLEFANMLHREHTANLKAGEALAAQEAQPGASSPQAEAMVEKGKAELATLAEKSGKEYEKAYVDAMVKGHTEALALLQDKLIPSAPNEVVRNFLTNSRDHVAMHLEHAKQLQAKQ